MTTKSTAFNYKECEKIDGKLVNAYIDAFLNPENKAELKIDSTWGEVTVDLTDAVKAAETVTHMELGSNAIEYFSEDGHVDCIYGDDLSRIISMHLLKDVDITTPPTDGDIYIYDGNTNKFKTFNLSAYMDSVGGNLTNLTSLLNDLRSRVVNIERKITPPENAPDGVSIAFGNINVYGDYTNGNLKTSGIYTHDPTTDVINDQYYS